MLMLTPRPTVPDCVRAVGGVRVLLGRTLRGTAPLEIRESGGFRVRFPRAGSPCGRASPCEAVLINTGGGLTGGDRVATEATLTPGARCVLTTQAAEKVYRSDGPDVEATVALTLGSGSRLDWLPQETILFDGARLRRRLLVEMAADAALLLVESTVFGRAAMGETVRSGAFRDRWRIRRDGRLVFAEDVWLEGPIAAALARPAVAKGGRAVATCLLVSPDAEGRLEAARAALEEAASECGVSAYGGMLVARFLSPDPERLRADLIRYTETLRGPLPRSWQT
jgi:urease accessory protein